MRRRNAQGRFQPKRKPKPKSQATTTTTEVTSPKALKTPLSASSVSSDMPSRITISPARDTSSTPSLAQSTSTIAATIPSTAERNIDHVVLGTLRFKAWYPSMYPKEIIGKEVIEGAKVGAAKGEYMLENLYVCRWCFGYTRNARDYLVHEDLCTIQGSVPGRRIYVHPGSKGEASCWEVWEVDGEVDTRFCQNLSLFAKLFLDNKSVFFDVPNFHYYLLVHTSLQTTHDTQVIGFFSKEKMSWDNNNLACILIFPPWQRKSLGNLLIAISYEISRRERVLGGPEKPISDLGKQGYLIFWGREIARWLLELKDGARRGGKGLPLVREVSVEDISQSTWIAIDDVLFTLREMGVVVRTGEKVSIDREALRAWIVHKGLSLGPLIDPDGFIEGYGYRETSDNGEMSE